MCEHAHDSIDSGRENKDVFDKPIEIKPQVLFISQIDDYQREDHLLLAPCYQDTS